MAGLSPELLAEINNTTLETFLRKGEVLKQNIQAKPMLNAFDSASGSFPGGKERVSFLVSAGQGGGALQGFTGDDQVNYYNPTGAKRAGYPWKEHHIGLKITMTELKIDGVSIDESSTSVKQTKVMMSDREKQALANRLDEKNEMLAEDYAVGLDSLIHGDGSSDTKALAGIRALVLDNPLTGSTGGVSRVANVWWRNRAATTAHAGAGGQGPITSAPTNGGVLIEFLEKEVRQLRRYAKGGSKWKWFAGSDFIAAYQSELRANGYYSQTGFMGSGNDGGMDDPKFKRMPIEYDPSLDDLGLAKRCYVLDISRRGLQLLYMDGQKMKRHFPARPYDRYVMYNGITMTGVLVAYGLRTSAVYDIT